MNTIAFRIWDKKRKKFWDSGSTPSMLKSFFENTAVLHTRDEMPYQQYTGLSDKNGVWIYEGDIVDCVVIGNKKVPASKIIIGNIYENPELLSDDPHKS